MAQHVDSAVATLNENPRIPRTTPDEYRRALFLPPRVPALTHLVVRDDGMVLVRPWPAPSGQADYMLFDSKGQLRNSLRLPPGARILAADDQRVIATLENGDGDVDIVAFLLEVSRP